MYARFLIHVWQFFPSAILSHGLVPQMLCIDLTFGMYYQYNFVHLKMHGSSWSLRLYFMFIILHTTTIYLKLLQCFTHSGILTHNFLYVHFYLCGFTIKLSNLVVIFAHSGHILLSISSFSPEYAIITRIWQKRV